ncbi:FtsB family cell division protein [Lederbergia lenta]|uniref:Cell division protein DivIC n=1 Tax=Lederbergia lenta TaxID=1467 RepID=A0A2X4VJK6_LEDLE|nr:septum formation initiator family protein [Lederbergia lenta]MCM3113571.1 septum formation initiator family protein [Lederbergia lenta]MEC2323840.1 septum formation initiator family protein [Lederbergia lenta]SQI51143.1 cell division protein DivIC [Lederbergia lenta]
MGAKKRMPIASLETNFMKQQEVSMRRAAKRKKLLIRRLSVFLVLALALSYLTISSYISRTSLLEAKKEEKVRLEATLAKLEKKQTMLENEVIKLNDDEYIAKLARSEYFLSDKGEIIFNIPEQKKKEEEDEVPY